MVIDSSAIFAAIAGEPDGAIYREAIKTAAQRFISAPTLLESQIVLFSRLGANAVSTLNTLVDCAGITVVPFDNVLADAAFDAFKRYGKGRGHPAQLNILDCAAYALAHSRGLPLLFKGEDFAFTDIATALS